jgi:osmotically-inducible protein OsmY
MGQRGKIWTGWLLVGLVGMACGCDNDDASRLARVGQKAVAKAGGLGAGANQKLATGLHALQGDLDESALDARVAARLRWDKTLADTTIEVRAEGGEVQLSGKVANLAQRRRAVELAESTLGSEKVTDGLEEESNK